MKVIITGSEGFIGKALAAALIKRGVQALSIDRHNGIEVGEYFANSDLYGIDIQISLCERGLSKCCQLQGRSQTVFWSALCMLIV